MLSTSRVGHTLGLNHNMGATTLHNNKDVHNPEITYKEGLCLSYGLSCNQHSSSRREQG